MKVRTLHGRTAHSPGCRHLRRTGATVNVPVDDPHVRLCASCHDVCFICMSDRGGTRMPCGARHSVCEECLGNHLQRVRGGRIRCPCGEGPDVELLTLSRTRLAQWTRQCGPTEQRSRQWTMAKVCDAAFVDRCPWCATPFSDYDGCAAVLCECHRWFCGLCLMRLDDNKSAHSHVRTCHHNPGDSYFVSTEASEAVRIVRSRRRLARVLEVVRSDRGVCLALLLFYRVAGVREDVVTKYHSSTFYMCALLPSRMRRRLLSEAWFGDLQMRRDQLFFAMYTLGCLLILWRWP